MTKTRPAARTAAEPTALSSPSESPPALQDADAGSTSVAALADPTPEPEPVSKLAADAALTGGSWIVQGDGTRTRAKED